MSHAIAQVLRRFEWRCSPMFWDQYRPNLGLSSCSTTVPLSDTNNQNAYIVYTTEESAGALHSRNGFPHEGNQYFLMSQASIDMCRKSILYEKPCSHMANCLIEVEHEISMINVAKATYLTDLTGQKVVSRFVVRNIQQFNMHSFSLFAFSFHFPFHFRYFISLSALSFSFSLFHSCFHSFIFIFTLSFSFSLYHFCFRSFVFVFALSFSGSAELLVLTEFPPITWS